MGITLVKRPIIAALGQWSMLTGASSTGLIRSLEGQCRDSLLCRFRCSNDEKSESVSDVRLRLDHLAEPVDLGLDLEASAMYMNDRGDP